MARGIVAFAVALLVALTPAVASCQEDPPPLQNAAVPGAREPERAPGAFTLDLGGGVGPREGFTLGLGEGGDGRYRFDRVEFGEVGRPPILAGLAAWSVGTSFSLGLEDGRPRVVLRGPLERNWDDLDGWEKFGVVLQTAAAAAAAVHFAGKLVEKLK